MKKVVAIFLLILSNFSLNILIGQGDIPGDIEEVGVEEKISPGKMEEDAPGKKEVTKKKTKIITTKKIPYLFPLLIVPQGNFFLYLNLDEKEMFTQSTFKELIKEHEKDWRPFILAVSASMDEESGKTNLRFYEANSFNKYVWNEKLTMLSKENDPQDNLPITSIHYFAIHGLKDEFTAIGSAKLLVESEKVRSFLITYFDASQENHKTGGALAELSKVYKETNKKKSEWFLKAAFHHGNLYAMNEVAKQKEDQGNLKEAFQLYVNIDKKIAEKLKPTEEPEDPIEMLEILEVGLEVMKKLAEFYQEGKGGIKINEQAALIYRAILQDLEKEKDKIETAKEESEIELQELED